MGDVYPMKLPLGFGFFNFSVDSFSYQKEEVV